MPNRCTQSGNQKLVGMQARPIMIVCRNTFSSSPASHVTKVLEVKKKILYYQQSYAIYVYLIYLHKRQTNIILT